MPGISQLCIGAKDWNVVGKNEQIGETHIDVESRYFSNSWRAFGQKKP
eukprot:SAG31_NODE_25742_length_455_cov_0.867978_2_plen_47_part_01